MEHKRKILYIITKSVWGGAQRYVYDLATKLPQNQFEVKVAAGGDDLLFHKLAHAGIQTIEISELQRDVHILKEFLSFWRLLTIFIREKPDIIHLNSTKAGGLGATAAKLASLINRHPSHVVFTVHGWGFHEKRHPFMRFLIFCASWLSSLLIERVICINTADLRAARSFIPKQKLTLIYNGIEPIDFFSRGNARNILSQKAGQSLENDTLVIGTIAELTRNKNIPLLLSALSRLHLDNWRALIIGEGEERKRLQNMIDTFLLNDRVILMGFLEDASRYLKGFDLFVLPSLKEGLPYSIIEAMWAGLPIIATNVGGIPDLIAHKVDGVLVHPIHPEMMQSAIEELMHDGHQQNHYRHRAREKIEAHFSLDAMITATIDLYLHE